MGNSVVSLLCAFDWQAISTLAVGLLAVAGAVYVGKKQTEILSRQVVLEDAKLRADLFERRLETFEATADFVLHISALPELDPLAEDRIARFGQKMRESQFLFSDPNVYKTLFQYWEKGNAARVDRSISIVEREESLPRDPERVRRLMDYPLWSLSTVETLSELFHSDLSIARRQ